MIDVSIPKACCCSVSQSCPTLCDPMDCSMPAFPVPHHLQKFAQVHVPCLSDAIQPSHPLTPSSSAINLSQYQGLFQWVSFSHTSNDQNTGVSASTSVLPSIQGWFPLRWIDLISLLSKGLWGIFPSTTIWRHQFFGTLPSLWSSSHNHTWPLGRP